MNCFNSLILRQRQSLNIIVSRMILPRKLSFTAQVCRFRISSFSVHRNAYAAMMPTYNNRNIKIHPLILCRQCSTTVTDKDSKYELVYTGSLSKRVMRLKMLSVGGSVVGLVLYPAVIKPIFLSSVGSAILFTGLSSIFLFGTPLLFHWVCKRYVIELDYDSDKKLFRATVSTLFLKKKHIVFRAEEVHVPGTPLFLTSFLVRGYPLLVNNEDFKDMDVFKLMMGYDKPMDFLLKDKK